MADLGIELFLHGRGAEFSYNPLVGWFALGGLRTSCGLKCRRLFEFAYVATHSSLGAAGAGRSNVLDDKHQRDDVYLISERVRAGN